MANESRWTIWIVGCALLLLGAIPAQAQQKRPNILVIMGDDIGFWNLSTYNQGMMGYRTPNIDSIANDGMKFTEPTRRIAALPAEPRSLPARVRFARACSRSDCRAQRKA